MKIHQQIYINHYNEIPNDENGCKYHIHHIDGNHSNNNIQNLIALSVQEHYDIHYKQKDWNACHRLSWRLNLSNEEISNLSRKAAQNRINNGTHIFLDKEWQKDKAKKQIENGTHNFLDKKWHKIRVQNQLNSGNHPFLNRQKVICPYCNKIGDKNLMKRWHFDNCKEKKK